MGKLVALDGIGIVQNERYASPIIYSKNMFRRKGCPYYNRDMKQIIDNDNSTSILIPKGFKGDVFVPCNKNDVTINVKYKNEEDVISSLSFFSGDDLQLWSEIDYVLAGKKIIVSPNADYLKVKMDCSSDISICEINYK